MTLWGRRKPVDLVASQIEATGQWEKPCEVDFIDHVIRVANANLQDGSVLLTPGQVYMKLPPRDKSWLETERTG